jgi:predicted AAA+ superfamily ATPase
MYIKRAVEDIVLKTSKMLGALFVTGPRQVDKTTLLQKLAEKERRYVTLDDPNVRLLAKRDPALFMQRYTPPVIIDEIQYAPEILPYIKMSIDRSKRKGDFWLSGSQMFHSMKNVSESLAGRVGIINLLDLSNSEINSIQSEPFLPITERMMDRIGRARQMGLLEIYNRIFKGSMPALYADEVDWETFYRSYVQTYLQRDIRDLTQVADEMTFLNFMAVVAARTAQPIVYTEIAKETGISAPTAKKWISVLVSSGIVALVQPYYNNILKRVIKSPLLHFLDTGLCAYLLKWGNPETLERGAMSGAFFESYVFGEIYKSWFNAGKEPPVYYYRDKDKREIDLLIWKDGTLYPIEIKKTAVPGIGSIKHFRLLNPLKDPDKSDAVVPMKMSIGSGALVCLADNLLPIDGKNWSVPVWII